MGEFLPSAGSTSEAEPSPVSESADFFGPASTVDVVPLLPSNDSNSTCSLALQLTLL